jgi:hypothetical protein
VFAGISNSGRHGPRAGRALLTSGPGFINASKDHPARKRYRGVNSIASREGASGISSNALDDNTDRHRVRQRRHGVERGQQHGHRTDRLRTAYGGAIPLD